MAEARYPVGVTLDEDWLEAFEAQATPKVWIATERYARIRAAYVAKLGGAVDELYVRELVQDAFHDTLEGIVAWIPARGSLALHLQFVIKSRTRHACRRLRRFPRISLSDPSAQTLAEVEAALPMRDEGVAETCRLVVEELRTLAAADPDVLLMLDAYEDGAAKKATVMATAKMTSHRYERTRKRLHRFVKLLSPELREAARLLA